MLLNHFSSILTPPRPRLANNLHTIGLHILSSTILIKAACQCLLFAKITLYFALNAVFAFCFLNCASYKRRLYNLLRFIA